MEKIIDEKLNNVSGGYIFHAKDISGADPNKPWELINEKGEVVGRYESRDLAIYNAGYNHENMMEINWDQLLQLRGLK